MLVAAVALYGVAPIAAATPQPGGPKQGATKQGAPKQNAPKQNAPKQGATKPSKKTRGDGAGSDAGARVPPGQIQTTADAPVADAGPPAEPVADAAPAPVAAPNGNEAAKAAAKAKVKAKGAAKAKVRAKGAAKAKIRAANQARTAESRSATDATEPASTASRRSAPSTRSTSSTPSRAAATATPVAPVPSATAAAPAAPATPATTRPPAARSTADAGSAQRSAAGASADGAAATAAIAASAQAGLQAAPPTGTTGFRGAVFAPTATPPRALVDSREDAAPAESQLTRTVVRVLEVIPRGVKVTLGALALLGLLLGVAVAVQTVRRRRLERQRRTLLADVGVLQSALLPVLPSRIGGARVSAAYRPAAGLAAGGDFYDAFELRGGRTAVLVGDIAGHGRDVVPLTALVRYDVRAYLEAGLSPRAALHVAANVLIAHLGERQVTIAVAIYDPGSGRLTYACAGHAPPLLMLPDDTVAPITTCSSPPLGSGYPTGRRQTTIAFPPGAVACLHTDGLDEAPLRYSRLGRDAVREELEAIGPQGGADDLIARVVRRSDRQTDDIAACILTALPGVATRWSLRLEELEIDAVMLSSGWAQRFLLACGVEGLRIATALREAQRIVARDGTAVLEVRIGEALVEVRVAAPPAIALPIAGRRLEPAATASSG